MRVERLPICPPLNPDLPVKVTTMGNIVEVQYMNAKNTKQTVKMLSGGQYVICATGEIKDAVRHENRAQLKNSLLRTFRTLRGLINANVEDVKKVRWVTLTYKENMTDAKRLYKDFQKFNKRFQYHIQKLGYNKAEYIAVAEPQARGAWHLHILFLFDRDAPYLDNDKVLNPLWGKGFSKIKQLQNVDNVGAYLTAYLGDIPLDELTGDADAVAKALDYFGGDKVGYGVKEVKGKKYVKGARLSMYPSKFNLYRCSRGIKRPVVEMMSQDKAREKVDNGKLVYEKTVQLLDDKNFTAYLINTRQYNLKARDSV